MTDHSLQRFFVDEVLLDERALRLMRDRCAAGAFPPEWERAAKRGEGGEVRVPAWRRCAVTFTGRATRARARSWQCAMRHGKELREAGRLRRAVEEQVIERFIECGDPHRGFVRIDCDACGHDDLLATDVEAAWRRGIARVWRRLLR